MKSRSCGLWQSMRSSYTARPATLRRTPSSSSSSIDLARVRPGHRQVVRAERAAHAGHRVAAAVAAGAVFELEDVAIVDAGDAQRARGAEAGDAGADDDRADAARQRDLGRAPGFRRRPATAQQVAALGVGADPAAFVARRVVARAGGERRRRRRATRRGRRGASAPRLGRAQRLTAAPCPTRPRRSGRGPGSTAD